MAPSPTLYFSTRNFNLHHRNERNTHSPVIRPPAERIFRVWSYDKGHHPRDRRLHRPEFRSCTGDLRASKCFPCLCIGYYSCRRSKPLLHPPQRGYTTMPNLRCSVEGGEADWSRVSDLEGTIRWVAAGGAEAVAQSRLRGRLHRQEAHMRRVLSW